MVLEKDTPFQAPEVEKWVRASQAKADIYGHRQEWKYCLTPELAAALHQDVEAVLSRETVVPGRRKTQVHTLYFDSPDFLLYRQAMAGKRSVKFRLRGYATAGQAHEGAEAQGYFECKIGLDGQKIKVRSTLPLATGTQWLGGSESGDAPAFLGEASRVIASYALKPRLTVSYEREAFVDASKQLRITFDTRYHASKIGDDLASPWPGARTAPWVIVEVKFVGEPPAWLLERLAAYGLPVGGESFSKFKTAVALLYPEHVPEGVSLDAP